MPPSSAPPTVSAVTVEPLPRRRVVRAFVLAGMLVAALAAFVYLLQHTATGGTDAFDRVVLAAAAAHRNPTLTAIAIDLTALGSRTLLTVGAALASVLLWTAKRRLAAIDTALASTVAALVTHVTKIGLARPRPAFAEPLVHTGGFSFPSGHASGITALLTAAALHTIEMSPHRPQRIFLGCVYGALIAGVAWSRVYLGVHYPSDVVAGVCVGVACALAAHGLLRTRAIVRWLRSVLRV